jgi:hypothetical protein
MWRAHKRLDVLFRASQESSSGMELKRQKTELVTPMPPLESEKPVEIEGMDWKTKPIYNEARDVYIYDNIKQGVRITFNESDPFSKNIFRYVGVECYKKVERQHGQIVNTQNTLKLEGRLNKFAKVFLNDLQNVDAQGNFVSLHSPLQAPILCSCKLEADGTFLLLPDDNDLIPFVNFVTLYPSMNMAKKKVHLPQTPDIEPQTEFGIQIIARPIIKIDSVGMFSFEHDFVPELATNADESLHVFESETEISKDDVETNLNIFPISWGYFPTYRVVLNRVPATLHTPEKTISKHRRILRRFWNFMYPIMQQEEITFHEMYLRGRLTGINEHVFKLSLIGYLT